jgi:hypothetical protein
MPTVNLGRVQPIYRGYYNAATAYEPLDFVTYDGNTYFCILNSTGNTPVSGTYWQAMSSGGLADFGVTATPAELNILDGATLTTAELNVLAGLLATTATLNSTAQLSGRNLIINGSGRVNQRGYVSGTATTAANQFTLDRWFVVTSGQNLTFTGTDAGRVMTAPAGGVSQVIAGSEIEGGTYVINWTGTATCTVGGTARAKGDTFTLTANANATIKFTSGTFSRVQVELGSIATPFGGPSYSNELFNAQWFYQSIPLHFAETGYAGFGGTGYNFRRMLTRGMRTTPAVASSMSSTLNCSVSVSAESNYIVKYSLTNTSVGNWSAFSNTLTADAEITS